ncbi:MAG: hypothetical protein AB4372_12655 [Xenococcus sp. (in: cyanobacteria)]
MKENRWKTSGEKKTRSQISILGQKTKISQKNYWSQGRSSPLRLQFNLGTAGSEAYEDKP